MATSAAVERSWCVSVPHHPIGAGVARGRLSAELSGVIRPGLLADAVAVLAELVGNAIRHADALPGDLVRVAWRVRYRGDIQTVTITVTDGGAYSAPALSASEPESLDGRGLAIVAALANSWGFERDGLGQRVWAEIAA